MLRIEGYVIVSADGMLADANRVMPEALKFKGDLEFFTAGLDRADVVVHGRNSFEDQPNSPLRKRIILTHRVTGIAAHPDNAKATLWNPAGASFDDACVHAEVRDGTAAIIGGPCVFEMFLDRYDTFWLSEAPHVTLPGGEGCFPGVPEDSPQAVLAAHGLQPREVKILDATNDVRVTAWRRIG
ncbi:MAG: dihydrofolate reductase [Nitrobacter sp.]|uniref:dihydrofolate reductase n=1 Tax=Nitrobacter sp. TaxID=29420 RepID=UPI00387DFE95